MPTITGNEIIIHVPYIISKGPKKNIMNIPTIICAKGNSLSPLSLFTGLSMIYLEVSSKPSKATGIIGFLDKVVNPK